MDLQTIVKDLPALLAAVLIGILFLQSGLDKVFDWKGNLEWLTGHFSKTFLSGTVPPMLATITVLEVATGALSLFAVVYFLITGSTVLIFLAALGGSLAVIALFFGQRVAKDYAGAAVLIPYFILLLGTMLLTTPYSRP